MAHPSHDLNSSDANDAPRIVNNIRKARQHTLGNHTARVTTPPNLDVWRSVDLGKETACPLMFSSVLQSYGMRVDEWAMEIMKSRSYAVSSMETSMELIRVSVKELGFHHGTQFHTILEEGYKHGLSLCPAEVGPQLRLQYRDQPDHEKLTVVMEPIMTTTGGYLRVFSLWHLDCVRQLRTSSGGPSSPFSADEILLFARNK